MTQADQLEFEPTEEDLSDINPVVVLLVACLANQVADLAKLHKMGAWKKSPAELGAWVRDRFRDGISGQGQLKTIAMYEYMIWTGRKTEALCETLETEAGLTVDPALIIRQAQRRSNATAGKERGSHVFQSTRGRMGGCRLVV